MRKDPDSNLLQNFPGLESGELRLWFRVFLDAFVTVRDCGGGQDVAWAWLMDPGNQFLESLAEHFDYTPEAFRQKVRRALERTFSAREKA
ncbi:MAG: hypothetical protein HPY65_00790 [Syntrophaceae bacterium]|nr:hypothetical protein [Syntrophaceae bacterium]